MSWIVLNVFLLANWPFLVHSQTSSLRGGRRHAKYAEVYHRRLSPQDWELTYYSSMEEAGMLDTVLRTGSTRDAWLYKEPELVTVIGQAKYACNRTAAILYSAPVLCQAQLTFYHPSLPQTPSTLLLQKIIPMPELDDDFDDEANKDDNNKDTWSILIGTGRYSGAQGVVSQGRATFSVATPLEEAAPTTRRWVPMEPSQ